MEFYMFDFEYNLDCFVANASRDDAKMLTMNIITI
jgi:hypothetical protein